MSARVFLVVGLLVCGPFHFFFCPRKCTRGSWLRLKNIITGGCISDSDPLARVGPKLIHKWCATATKPQYRHTDHTKRKQSKSIYLMAYRQAANVLLTISVFGVSVQRGITCGKSKITEHSR